MSVVGQLPTPGIHGVVQPVRGTGLLRFYQDLGRPLISGTITFMFNGERWDQTGRQPFSWNYLPPVGERRYPILRIAAARDVIVRERRAGRKAVGVAGLPGALGPVAPLVEIYRPQDNGLVPGSDELIDVDRIIGEPTIEGPRTLNPRGLWEALTTVSVRPRPAGVVIGNVNGLFEIDVALEDSHRPGAFAYDIDIADEPTLIFSMRLVHSSNIDVRVRASEDVVDSFMLATAFVPLGDVPPQGTPLNPDAYDFDRWPRNRTQLFGGPLLGRGAAIFLIELGISVIPYFGILYGIGQFAYAAATGEDFWGRAVDDGELLVMGILAAIPAAARASRMLRDTARRIADARGLPRLVDPAVLDEVARLGDPEFLRAVGGIRPEAVNRVFVVLARHAAGKAAARDVLKAFDDAVLDGYLAAIAQRRLTRVFSTDFQGFSNVRLSKGYNAYLAGARGRARDAVGWALAQRGRSRYREELMRALGDDFVEVIQRARPRIIPEVDVAALRHYGKLAGRVVTYRTLARLNRGYGSLYQADHLVEQRFWYNDPRIASAFDEGGEGFAFLVPINAAVAARMRGLPILYVHQTKTTMLRELIPDGAETMFTLQQTWDAHVFVLQALGAHPSVYGARMRDMFKIMAEELGQTVNFRVRPLAPTAFLPENGWPEIPAFLLPAPRSGEE